MGRKGGSMNVLNHQHNSGKPPKRRLKPQALRAAKARRNALLHRLQSHDSASRQRSSN
jgi:hypothetical protein